MRSEMVTWMLSWRYTIKKKQLGLKSTSIIETLGMELVTSL